MKIFLVFLFADETKIEWFLAVVTDNSESESSSDSDSDSDLEKDSNYSSPLFMVILIFFLNCDRGSALCSIVKKKKKLMWPISQQCLVEV
jgi:hypothetical protein